MNDYSYGIIPIFKTRYENLFLLLHSTHGHWTFPKGHREGTETDEETARRELLEESGIKEVNIPDKRIFYEKYSFDTGNGEIVHKTNTLFIGYVSDTDVTIQKEEVTEFRWVTADEAMELVWPECRKIIEEVTLYLKNNA